MRYQEISTFFLVHLIAISYAVSWDMFSKISAACLMALGDHFLYAKRAL